MLSDIARTRPSRSPSQPKNTPPVAAPTRNPAMMMPFHGLIAASCFARDSWPTSSSSINAGRATTGNRPISKPSNIQPSSAAISASQRPRFVVVSPINSLALLRQVRVEPVGDLHHVLVHAGPTMPAAGMHDEFRRQLLFPHLVDEDLCLLDRHQRVLVAMNNQTRCRAVGDVIDRRDLLQELLALLRRDR